jgi:antitoxin PrlF
MVTARVTSLGRITIPKQIRDSLGLKSGDWVRITIDEGRLVMRPAKAGLQDLRGTIEPRQEPEDFGVAREKAKKAMARRRANPRRPRQRDG